jgi:putative pyruvate formate lyase activating enzyme
MRSKKPNMTQSPAYLKIWRDGILSNCPGRGPSQQGAGREVTPAELASLMLHLQAQGCHNINLVSPSHVVHAVLAALEMAIPAGLRLPIVYNTGGYDDLETLALLDGVIDIYMPDMKYADSATGRLLSRVRNYSEINRQAVREMHRQVGDLELDEQGVATRGLLVRHLVLPSGLAGSDEIFRFLATGISTNTYLNVMEQYHPDYKANRHSQLQRRPTHEEYLSAVTSAHRHGLHRLDARERRRSVFFF